MLWSSTRDKVGGHNGLTAHTGKDRAPREFTKFCESVNRPHGQGPNITARNNQPNATTATQGEANMTGWSWSYEVAGLKRDLAEAKAVVEALESALAEAELFERLTDAMD